MKGKNLVFNHVGKISLNLSVKDLVAELIFFYYKQLKNINVMWSERHLLLPISQVSKIVLLLGDKDVLIWRVSLEYYPVLQAVLLGRWPCTGVQSSPALCKMLLWSWSEAVCPELAVVTAFPFLSWVNSLSTQEATLRAGPYASKPGHLQRSSRTSCALKLL